MFIPFIFVLETTGEYDHIGQFYKYFDMVKRYNWPIIAHERYFNNLDYMETTVGLTDVWFNTFCSALKFERPTQSELDNIPKYKIPYSFERDMISHFPSQLDAWIFLLKNNYEPFEQLIDQFIDDIIDRFNEPIEAFICYMIPKSLRKVAEKRNIPIINEEGGPIRPPFYNQRLMLFDRKSVHGNSECQDRYLKFCDEIKHHNVPILSRKEIVTHFVSEQYASDISCMDMEPVYDVGLLYRKYQYGTILQYTHITNEELNLITYRKYPFDSVLIRPHPGHGMESSDDSPTSFHFICKCKKIVGAMSSVFFETMLLERTPCMYGQMSFSFMCNQGLEDTREITVPLEFINFYIFSYCIPFEWMTDVEYLRFRLSNPSEVDVYMKGFNYLRKQLL